MALLLSFPAFSALLPRKVLYFQVLGFVAIPPPGLHSLYEQWNYSSLTCLKTTISFYDFQITKNLTIIVYIMPYLHAGELMGYFRLACNIN